MNRPTYAAIAATYSDAEIKSISSEFWEIVEPLIDQSINDDWGPGANSFNVAQGIWNAVDVIAFRHRVTSNDVVSIIGGKRLVEDVVERLGIII